MCTLYTSNTHVLRFEIRQKSAAQLRKAGDAQEELILDHIK
jgi:hypothetical protein